jgi:tetratricopeptide (TPR) repeat protein
VHLWDEAYEDHNVVIRQEPNDRESHVRRGHILRDRGDYPAAAQDYERAVELGDDQPLTYYGRAVCRRKMRQLDAALQDVESAIKRRPEEPEFHLLRGQIYVAMGKIGRAEADFAKTIDADPDDARAYFGRGTVYAAADRIDRAIEDFTAALERDPANAGAFHRRGEVYLRAKKLPQALADFGAAIRLDPDFALAYCSRGWLLARSGRPQAALIELTKVGSRASDDAAFAAAFDARARVWYSMGQYRKALADYARVIELKPEGHDFARMLYGRGLTLIQLGELEKAEKSFSRAIEIQPKLEPARKLMEWVRGDRTEAIPELRKPAKVLGPRTPPKCAPEVELVQQADDAWATSLLWDQWLVRTAKGVECGPVTKIELDLWCRQGRLDGSTYIWRVDRDEWLPAGDVYAELLVQSHRSANRPIPLSQVPEPQEPQEPPEPVLPDSTTAEPTGDDAPPLIEVTDPKRGSHPPPDEDIDFPGIKI